MMLVLATLLVVAGLVGVVMPAVPGTILIFAGLLLAAWSDGFVRVGVPTMVRSVSSPLPPISWTSR